MLLNPWRFRRVRCRKFPSSAASVEYNKSRYLIKTKNTLKLRTNTNFQSANGENCGCLDQIILNLFPSSWVQRGSLFNTFQLCPLALTCTIYQRWHDELVRIGISLRHRQGIKKKSGRLILILDDLHLFKCYTLWPGPKNLIPRPTLPTLKWSTSNVDFTIIPCFGFPFLWVRSSNFGKLVSFRDRPPNTLS